LPKKENFNEIRKSLPGGNVTEESKEERTMINDSDSNILYKDLTEIKENKS